MPDGRFGRALRWACEEDTFVWLLASSPDGAAVRRVLDTWAGTARDAMASDPGGHLFGPVTTREGASLVGFVEGRTADIERLTDELLAGLRDAQVPGQLRLVNDTGRSADLAHGVTLVSASVRWRPDAPERVQQRLRLRQAGSCAGLSRVDLEPEAWRQVVALSMDWLAELGEDADWYVEGVGVALDRAAAAALTAQAVAVEPLAWWLTVEAPTGGRLRSVVVDYRPPRVLYAMADGSRSASPAERAAEARELLTVLAPHLNSAFAANSDDLKGSTVNLLEPAWKGVMAVPTRDLATLALLDGRLLIDAFGVVHLGPDSAGWTPPPDGPYGVEPVGDGRLLVHRQPEAWFGAQRGSAPPERQVLAEAREALRPVLATPEDVATERRRHGAWRESRRTD